MALRGDTGEYARQREFYRENARDSEFLEEIVRGDTTFKERLDWLISGMELSDSRVEFSEYLDLVTMLGAEGFDRVELEKLCRTFVNSWVVDIGHGLAIGAMGFGIVLSAMGPLVIAEPLIAAAGMGGIKALHKKRKYLADMRKRKEEIFSPLYDAAESLDHQIGRCFLLNHFHDNRKRFEETYRRMPQEEREGANETLYGLLGVGGMKDMDQLKLDDYLEELLKPEGDN